MPVPVKQQVTSWLCMCRPKPHHQFATSHSHSKPWHIEPKVVFRRRSMDKGYPEFPIAM